MSEPTVADIHDGAAADVAVGSFENTPDQPFRLKALPIVTVVALGLGLLALSELSVDLIADHVRLPLRESHLAHDYAVHTAQFLLALSAIALIRRWVPADYGLHLPRGKSYVLDALAWGALFGVLMTLVDYGPHLLTQTAPVLNYPLSRNNVFGWLFFEGVFVGPTEEVPFRALLLTYLAATMPGKVHFRGYDMNGAGIVVAAIFALAHVTTFITQPLWTAFGQQIYAFALGILYAYWFEKSKSVLAPIVGHNVSDFVEYALLFAMVSAWG